MRFLAMSRPHPLATSGRTIGPVKWNLLVRGCSVETISSSLRPACGDPSKSPSRPFAAFEQSRSQPRIFCHRNAWPSPHTKLNICNSKRLFWRVERTSLIRRTTIENHVPAAVNQMHRAIIRDSGLWLFGCYFSSANCDDDRLTGETVLTIKLKRAPKTHWCSTLFTASFLGGK
jgi:hypothetical protein